jgi:hypothetical protein
MDRLVFIFRCSSQQYMDNTDLGTEIIVVVFYSSKYSGSLIYFYKRINLTLVALSSWNGQKL